MSNPVTLGLGSLALLGAAFVATVGICPRGEVRAAAGPMERPDNSYRVLVPIESGNLLLFPVVRTAKSPGVMPFLTLDEGIKSGLLR